MDKKGEVLGIGILLSTIIAIIIGLILFQSIAQNVGQVTDTGTWNTTAYTIPATQTDLTGQELISITSIVNQTGAENCAANVTIAETISKVDGLKRISITDKASRDAEKCTKLNISYIYGPEGYIDDSGGRGIAGVIVIFTALVIGLVALVPTLRSGVLNMMGR